MTSLVTAVQIYPALKALLGLPEHLVSFELRVNAEEYGVIVACEHYVYLDAPGLKQLESVLGEYQLVHREQAAPQSAEFVDFDAWMRARTERAHAAYMAGHAGGGIAYN